MTPRLYFEYSTWFFIVCLLLGVGYALLLYFRVKNPWSTTTNRILFLLRFGLIALLAGLLVGPFLRLTKNTFEKPLIVFAIDNSTSMKLTSDSLNLDAKVATLKNIQEQLNTDGFETRARAFDELTVDGGFSFSYPETDLSNLMRQIANDYEGFNLSTVVLFSDGIYNTGISPTYSSYQYPIFTVGAGDTTKNKDVLVQNVLYNKISYLGNKFPIVVDVVNEGYVNETGTVRILKNGQVIQSTDITFTSNQVQQVEFLLEADEVGLQRYVVSMPGKSEEFTLSNNRAQVFIDVVDGKENILLVGSAPHPDLKALRAAIESNENYEIQTFIPGIHDWPDNLDQVDLVILHQIPDYKQVLGANLKKVNEMKASKLHLVGAKTNINSLNKTLSPTQIVRTRNEGDVVKGVPNLNFGLFEMSGDLKDLIGVLPPLRAPFGPIIVDANAHILLYQQVGSIVTDRPLVLFLNQDESKAGVIFAEGMWQWRLSDYAQNKNNDRFDELILKTVQYLTTKDDKRKFRLYSRKNEYVEKEQVVFQAEAYNALYEPLYGIKVDVTLSNEGADQNFSFVTSQSNSSYTIRNLVPGIYTYTGTANVNGTLESTSGEFVVEEINIEATNLTADHHLLRDLAGTSGGTFYYASDMDGLYDELVLRKPPEIIHTSEQFLPLINLKWAFFVLLLLISSEWFVRKYQGGY